MVSAGFSPCMHIIRPETMGRRLASAKSLAKSRQKSHRESRLEILGETLRKTLGETFHARQGSPQSLGSDYMQNSPQDSPSIVFLRGQFF